ncbi:MAG: cytochrome P450 [Myxococcota bacterium]
MSAALRLPTVGSLRDFAAIRARPLRFIVDTWRAHGDLVWVRFGGRRVLLANHPRHVQHVLVRDANRYSKATRGQALLVHILGRGLLTSSGDFWKRQRRIAQPAFRRAVIAGFAETMRTATLDLVADLRANPGPINLNEVMSRLTLRIAGETLFSQDISARGDTVGENLSHLVEDFTRLGTHPLPGWERFPTPKNLAFNRALQELDRVVFEIIRQRRSEAPVADLLGLFMAAVDDDDGSGMTDQQLRDEVLTMLLAGHETTASAMTWTLMLLSQHPAIARRLYTEVSALPPERAWEAPYVKQVVEESMRLYPPAWIISRRAEQDTELDGALIPTGTSVYLTTYAAHRHPDFWDNPEGFDPDRFAPDRPRPAPGAYLPFGGGGRKCIGNHFAMMEARIILSILVRHFSVALGAGQIVRPQASVTLRPAGGLWAEMRVR